MFAEDDAALEQRIVSLVAMSTELGFDFRYAARIESRELELVLLHLSGHVCEFAPNVSVGRAAHCRRTSHQGTPE